VANRIKDIKKYDLDEIRYITTENPADLLTRSNFESLVPETRLYGPSWLSSDEHDWPKNNFQTLEPTEEISSQPTLISVEAPAIIPTPPYNLKIENYSSFDKLWRITAYCVKFQSRSKRSLSNNDIAEANLLWIRYEQRIHFASTYQNLEYNYRHRNDNKIKQKRDALQQQFSPILGW